VTPALDTVGMALPQTGGGGGGGGCEWELDEPLPPQPSEAAASTRTMNGRTFVTLQPRPAVEPRW
jgi:hypothetical protein